MLRRFFHLLNEAVHDKRGLRGILHDLRTFEDYDGHNERDPSDCGGENQPCEAVQPPEATTPDAGPPSTPMKVSHESYPLGGQQCPGCGTSKVVLVGKSPDGREVHQCKGCFHTWISLKQE